MRFSSDFWEKAVLLVLTGVVSGFFIPLILKIVDGRKLKEQKGHEANIARQNNVIEAQIKLLENLSESLWELQLLSLAVSYYKVHFNEQKYEVALKDYDEKSWILFKKIRCEISKASRLVSEDKYLKLLAFFEKSLVLAVDEKLMGLIEKTTLPEEWKKYYDWLLYDLPWEIDKVVTPIAQELQLASPKAMSNNAHARRPPRLDRL